MNVVKQLSGNKEKNMDDDIFEELLNVGIKTFLIIACGIIVVGILAKIINLIMI